MITNLTGSSGNTEKLSQSGDIERESMLLIVSVTMATLIPAVGALFGVIILWKKSHRFRRLLSRSLPAACLPSIEDLDQDVTQGEKHGASGEQGAHSHMKSLSAPRGWLAGKYVVSKPQLRTFVMSDNESDSSEVFPSHISRDPLVAQPLTHQNKEVATPPKAFWSADAKLNQIQIDNKVNPDQNSRPDIVKSGFRGRQTFNADASYTEVAHWRNELFAAAQKNAANEFRASSRDNMPRRFQPLPVSLAATGDVVLLASKSPRRPEVPGSTFKETPRRPEVSGSVFFHSNFRGSRQTLREAQLDQSQNGLVQSPVLPSPKTTNLKNSVAGRNQHAELAALHPSFSGSPRRNRTPLEELLAESSFGRKKTLPYAQGWL